MKNTKRLSIELREEDHKEIKRRALERNMSMTDWVVMAIIRQITDEKRAE